MKATIRGMTFEMTPEEFAQVLQELDKPMIVNDKKYMPMTNKAGNRIIWTPEIDQTITSMRKEGYSYENISQTLGIGGDAIRRRYMKIQRGENKWG